MGLCHTLRRHNENHNNPEMDGVDKTQQKNKMHICIERDKSRGLAHERVHQIIQTWEDHKTQDSKSCVKEQQ